MKEDSSDEWNLIEVENGIRIWEKKLNGIPIYKSSCIIQAKPKQIATVIMDVSHSKQWRAYTKEANILKHYSDNTNIIYLKTNSKYWWFW